MRYNPYNEIQSQKPVHYETKTLELTVMWFSHAKGFGFGRAADGSEHQIHYSDTVTDPKEGDVITATIRVKVK